MSNLATFGDCEAAVTNWATIPGTSGTASGAQSTLAAHSGSNGYRSTWTVTSTTDSGAEYYVNPIPGVPRRYFARCWVKSSLAKNFQLRALYRNAAFAPQETDVGPTVSVSAATWTELVLNTPCTTVTLAIVMVSIQVVTTGAGIASGNTIDVDDMVFRAVPPPPYPSVAVRRAALY